MGITELPVNDLGPHLAELDDAVKALKQPRRRACHMEPNDPRRVMNATEELEGLIRRRGGHVKATARDLLAAGYLKPRTITTSAELDALPVGSVVLRRGRAFQRFAPHPGAYDEYKMWQCPDGGFVRSTKDGSSILPATVLYEPGAAVEDPTTLQSRSWEPASRHYIDLTDAEKLEQETPPAADV